MSASRSTGPLDVTTLVFHKLTPRITWGINNLHPGKFQRLLGWLRNEGFGLVGQSENSAGAPEQPLVHITFDDGYRHLIDALPNLIEQFSFQPLVFVPTAFIGQDNRWDYSHYFANEPHLSESEIKDLAKAGVRFGAHGHTHTALTTMNEDEARQELRDSKDIIEQIAGERVDSISYPFGRYNQQVLEIASELGYESGYSMAFPERNDLPLTVGRVSVHSTDTGAVLRRKLFRTFGHGFDRFKAGAINRLSGGTILLNRLRGDGRDRG